MTSLLLSYIWGWKGAFPGHFGACVLLYGAIGGLSHVRRGEGLRDIGVRLDNWQASGLDAMRVVAPLALVLITYGAARGTLHFPSLEDWPGKLLSGAVWGAAQQYGLVCFFYRRLREALPDPNAALVGSGLLFALFHLPNPFLTMATLLLGMISCWLYRREPNLAILGAAHGLLSFVIAYSLPESLTLGRRVGPGLLELR